MKIAIVNQKYLGGATRSARDLERSLSLRHSVRYYPRNGKETVASLLNDLSEFLPDVVHCHGFYSELPYEVLAKVSHLYPTCFTPHDPRPIGTLHPTCWDCPHAKTCFCCPLVRRLHRYTGVLNPYFLQRSWKRYVHWRTAGTLRLVSVSRWFQERLMKTELRRFPITHIPHGIDLTHFRPILNARSELKLPLQNKIILYVVYSGDGWNSYGYKGLRYLADAFVQHVVPAYPDALLMVAGEGLIPNHPNVKPVGLLSQEKLPLYYSAADVFVSPTLADNLPYTVLEAMACGTPVVASKVGGIPEEVEEGITGHLVPPGDSEALGQAILSILESREKRECMSRASRARAELFFNLENFVQRHEELYQKMVE